jgi:predicted amino acid-binding ACT domain protein
MPRQNFDLRTLRDDLQKAAQKLGLSMNAVVNIAVREWLERNRFKS